MDFKSRILIIKDDEVLFYKGRINDNIHNEIYQYTKDNQIEYPIEIWQEMYFTNGDYKFLKLCTILGWQKK